MARFFIYIIFVLWPLVALAQGEIDVDSSVLFQADEVKSDIELGIITARGNVALEYKSDVLSADMMVYNELHNLVTATGSVRLMRSDGSFIESEYIEISQDLKKGFIKALRARLENNSRLSANDATLSNEGKVIEYSRASYTRCEVCKENPDKPVLWRLKAQKVVHDRNDQEIEYYHTTVEVGGVPVFYTPYFFHPDPSVKRKSGFLTPRFGSSGSIGTYISVPYFWAIEQDQDLTIEPVIMTKEIPLLYTQYRHAFERGNVDIEGSFTQSDRKKGLNNQTYKQNNAKRGHIFAGGQYSFDSTWRGSADYKRVSDRTYLGTYNFLEGDDGNELRSEYRLEGFRGRNYVRARANHYQDLRTNRLTGETTPEIFPQIIFSGLGDVDSLGGRWNLETQLRNYHHSKNVDVKVASLGTGYQRSFVAPQGLNIDLDGLLRSDFFSVDASKKIDNFGARRQSNNRLRVNPLGGIDLTWPFARYSETGRQVITPRLAYIASTKGGNSADIPASDSTGFDVNVNNMFQTVRFAGIDRFETGHRSVYGISGAHYWSGNAYLSGFVGQTLRLSEDSTLEREFDLREGGSDILTHIDFNPDTIVRLTQQANISRVTGALRRMFNKVEFDYSDFNIDLTHSMFKGVQVEEYINQIAVEGQYQLSDKWSVLGGAKRDLHNKTPNRTIVYNFGMVYEDECLIFKSEYSRDLVTRTGVDNGSVLMFTVSLK
ncbi:MAG: LPS assembly protein LptD, partial [Pseudomonadota bacterium]